MGLMITYVNHLAQKELVARVQAVLRRLERKRRA